MNVLWEGPVKINWSSFNCTACGGPLSNGQVSDGEKSNRINTLGARLVESRQQKKKQGRWTITPAVLDILTELAELGASLDEQGFVTRRL